MSHPSLVLIAVAMLFITGLTTLVFHMYPNIDIWASGLFFDAEHGFWRRHDLVWTYARELVINSYTVIFIYAFIVQFMAKEPSRGFQVPKRVYSFICWTFFIGAGVVTNLIFKDNWGRARPNNVQEFGGNNMFSLPFEIVNECDRNCSFVSGEGSAVSVLVVSLLIVLWAKLSKSDRKWAVGLGALYIFAGCFMRIAKGRHFLSDTLIAFEVMTLMAIGIAMLYGFHKNPPAVTLQMIRHDIVLFKKIIVDKTQKLTSRNFNSTS